MRLLLDECLARNLKRDLVGHEVMTVVEAGYGGMKNGALLRAASGNFDVFITVDRNLPLQQNVCSFQLGIVMLKARGITYDDVSPLAPKVLETLKTIQPGQVVEIVS
jgi:predicted nuclease of predicted toxin-antitoxin system